jgi:allantoinase
MIVDKALNSVPPRQSRLPWRRSTPPLVTSSPWSWRSGEVPSPVARVSWRLTRSRRGRAQMLPAAFRGGRDPAARPVRAAGGDAGDKGFGGLLIAHAEDPDIIDGAAASGHAYHRLLPSRPDIAEQRAVAGLIHAALETGCRVHLVHVSSVSVLPRTRPGPRDMRAAAPGRPVTMRRSGFTSRRGERPRYLRPERRHGPAPRARVRAPRAS